MHTSYHRKEDWDEGLGGSGVGYRRLEGYRRESGRCSRDRNADLRPALKPHLSFHHPRRDVPPPPNSTQVRTPPFRWPLIASVYWR